MSAFIEKANSHMQKFKTTNIDQALQLRLVVDQFPLSKQIQSSCDIAKLFAARLTGKEAPVYQDTETTYGQIQERIQNTLTYLKTIEEKDFTGWEEKTISFPWMPGQYLKAKDYIEKHAIPNFYFHLTTAYAILRANGVELGKGDFLGALPFIKNN